MPWGRGGAGNIAQVEEANKRAAEDLEASQQAAETTLDPSPADLPTRTDSNAAVAAAAAAPPLQEYAHMGRGGAGNYYSPASLEQTGTFSAPGPADTSTAEPVREADPGAAAAAAAAAAAPDMPIARTGRGGAGNFHWAEQQPVQGGAERNTEEQVRERVESDVEKGLSRPPNAFLGNGKEMDRFAEGH
ncbi:hypothetical protein K490DRAFT_31526 [Saccharata proteae CBS 121410]|uniref:Uncharacterized protein n=1 Tax=Saccharata proteae CBS 121410 TaxID=1314787 RepID=A0A9P4M1U8_9PEZI|nr:hypothetical protein K490DRAFT_31526 [Saccharata proteae CBS 121410]